MNSVHLNEFLLLFFYSSFVLFFLLLSFEEAVEIQIEIAGTDENRMKYRYLPVVIMIYNKEPGER